MKVERPTFADWRGFSPAEAAAHVRVGLGRLTPSQRRAVIARVLEGPALEAALAAAGSGPLRGLPALAKDLYPKKGYALGAGSRFLAEERGLEAADATLLTDWTAAGGVWVGQTQLHEFAYGITGENPHFGDVEHPFDPARTSGGSSSGSAVAVAKGLVPLAFGTDTAGSLRVPAAFCGLYAVRFAPRERWIADVFPLSPSFDTAGWFTATAEDMRQSLMALRPTPRPRSVRLAWLDLPGVEPVAAAAQRRKAESLGATPLPGDLARRLCATWVEAGAAFRAVRAPEAWAVHRAWRERRAAEYDPRVWARLCDGAAVTAEEVARGEIWRQQWSSLLEELWVECDALAVAAVPGVAWRHEECTQANRDRLFALTTAVSVAGCPALTLPVALDGPLTTGVQVVVPAGKEGPWAHVLEVLS